jgi:hypothetical protein
MLDPPDRDIAPVELCALSCEEVAEWFNLVRIQSGQAVIADEQEHCL